MMLIAVHRTMLPARHLAASNQPVAGRSHPPLQVGETLSTTPGRAVQFNVSAKRLKHVFSSVRCSNDLTYPKPEFKRKSTFILTKYFDIWAVIWQWFCQKITDNQRARLWPTLNLILLQGVWSFTYSFSTWNDTCYVTKFEPKRCSQLWTEDLCMRHQRHLHAVFYLSSVFIMSR